MLLSLCYVCLCLGLVCFVCFVFCASVELFFVVFFVVYAVCVFGLRFCVFLFWGVVFVFCLFVCFGVCVSL